MNFSYIMYIGLEYVMALPKRVLSSFVLYCKNSGRLKFRTLKNPERLYFQTLFLFQVKIERKFFASNVYNLIMYSIFLQTACLMQRIDERLVQKISELVKEGVTSVAEMKQHLHCYVKKEIFMVSKQALLSKWK